MGLQSTPGKNDCYPFLKIIKKLFWVISFMQNVKKENAVNLMYRRKYYLSCLG